MMPQANNGMHIPKIKGKNMEKNCMLICDPAMDIKVILWPKIDAPIPAPIKLDHAAPAVTAKPASGVTIKAASTSTINL